MKRRKLLYAVCLAVTFVLNIFYENAEIYLLFYMMAVVGIVTWGMYVLSKIGLKLYCAFGSRMSVKDELYAGFKLNNKLPLRTAWCSLKISAEMSNGGGLTQQEVALAAFLNKIEEKTAQIPTEHCGIVNLYIEELTCRDFLGIFQKKYRYNYVKRIVVLPELVYADETQPQTVLEEDLYRATYQEVESTEVIEVRNYQDGDSMSRIHWNLSAVSEEYIVKQYGEETKHCAYILLDLDKKDTPNFRKELDCIYTAAYSIGNLYVLQGIRACFLAWNSAAKCAYEGEFTDFEELGQRMAEVMSIPCADHALDSMDEYVRTKNYAYQGGLFYPIMLITASAIEDALYDVYDVKENLQEKLSNVKNDLETDGTGKV